WQGYDAELAKKMLGEKDATLLQDILDLQTSMVQLQNDILEKFRWDVDSDYDARIEYDTLEEIDNDFIDFYNEFNDNAKQIDTMVDTLTKLYGKYGSFTSINNTGVIQAFADICSAVEPNTGYMHECMNKLTNFDDEATELILDTALDKKIADIECRMLSIEGFMLSFINSSASYSINEEELRNRIKDETINEAKEILEKNEWTQEELETIAQSYQKAVENQDEDLLEVILLGIMVVENEKITNSDGTESYKSFVGIDASKIASIKQALLNSGVKNNTETIISLNEISCMNYSQESEKRIDHTGNIVFKKTGSNLLITWNVPVCNSQIHTDQRMIFSNNLYDSSYTTIEAIQKRYEELKQLSGVDVYKEFYKEYNVEEVIITPTEEKLNTCIQTSYKIYDLISSLPNYRLPDSCREEIETVTQTISDYSYDFGQSLKEHSAKIIDETPEFLYCTSSIFVVIDQTTLITDLCNGTYDKEKTKQRSSKNYKSFMKGATNALIDLGVGIFETPDLIADIYYGTEDIKAEVKDVVQKSNGDVTQIYEYATSKISALKEGIIETKDEAVEYVTNMNEDDIYESAGYITLTVLSLFVGGEASKASNISKVSEASKVEKVLKTGKTGFWDDLVNKVKGKSSSVKNKVSKGKGSYKGTAPVENSKYLDDINDFYEGIFDEQRLVDPEYEDYLDDLSELNKVSQDDIGLEMNESPEPEASSGHQSGNAKPTEGGGSTKGVAEAVNRLKNVEDDILDVMESLGGHTLDRHVGKSKEYLIERTKKLKGKGATTYISKEIATKSVKDVLSKNSNDIVEWLNNSTDARLTIKTEHSFEVGNGVLKNTDTLTKGLRKTVTVIERTNDNELGFRIITSYPVFN
ncbi:MAG: hypothetical protein IIW92_01805, partial [Lachnospiraceae bacterium]|nr:hypothetical protein [Lachnospiraceae bacterium]